jgi:radical SAM superfamily enzyme YgiQ (UPF0313 family)
MRILFIRNTCSTLSHSQIGFGVGIIATIADKAGYDVKVIDNNSQYKSYTEKEIIKIIKSYKPDVLAYSIMIQNAYETYQQIPKIKRIFPIMPIIAGGVHMRRSFEEALRHGADVVVNREGEKVILPLLEHLSKRGDEYKKDLESVPGVSFRKEDGSYHFATDFPGLDDLDDVPVVNYRLFNIADFIKTKNEPGLFYITAQRGCPFKCTFCSDPIQRADKRIASADWLFKNVVDLHERYGSYYIVIADNNFTINRRRVVEFCNKIIESGLNKKITFSCQTKVQTVLDEEIVRLMKEAGFRRVNFGLERLVPYSLEKIKKETSIERVHNVLALLVKNGIDPSIFMMVGFPFETKELLQQEKEAFLSLSKYTKKFSCSILCPIPGTIYYDDVPKAKEWYLNGDDLVKFKAHFTSILETHTMHVVDKNFFDFSDELKQDIIDFYLTFKEINHGAVFIKRSLALALVLKLDLLVARLSQAVFYFSPSLEFLIFRRVRAIRYYLGTYFLGRNV